jgi:hypothetical protein
VPLVKVWEAAICCMLSLGAGYLFGAATAHRQTSFYRSRLSSMASMSARHWHVFHPEYPEMRWEFSRLAVEAAER